MMDTVARMLARYALTVRHEDFPKRARALSVDAITDTFACMLVGSCEPLAGMMLNVIQKSARPEHAHAALIGTALYASAADAALYNGAIAHALDYDDVTHPAMAHAGVVLVPAILAVAPAASASGRDIVSAYILGIEVMGKLGRALNTAHYKKGWHATATFGTLAGAVVAGRLLQLSESQLTMAIGIAASAAGGLRANFGTMVKPLHAGYAARNGVLAALLAREGMIAAEDSIENRCGFVRVFNHDGDYDLAPLSAWGKPLEILTSYGIALKPYPSCAATHTSIEAAMLLRHDIKGVPIHSVRAGISPMALEPLNSVMPSSALEAKFNLPYCVASALTDGIVNLATFGDAKIADPAIRELIPKIEVEVDERFRGATEFPAAIKVVTKNGNCFERIVPLAIGKPERWFSEKQLHDKFFECGERALPTDQVEAAYSMLRHLDRAAGVGELVAALRAAQ